MGHVVRAPRKREKPEGIVGRDYVFLSGMRVNSVYGIINAKELSALGRFRQTVALRSSALFGNGGMCLTDETIHVISFIRGTANSRLCVHAN